MTRAGDLAVRLREALETIRVLAAPDAAAKLLDAEETIRILRRALKWPGGKFYAGLDCGRQEAVALHMLLNTVGTVDRAALADRLSIISTRDDGGHPVGSINVMICRLRVRLKGVGAEFDTVRGRGWSMDGRNKAIVNALERMA